MSIKEEITFRATVIDPSHMGDPDNDLNYAYRFFFKPGIEKSVRELTRDFNRAANKGPRDGEWPESRYDFFKKGFSDPDMQIILHNGERVGCFCISLEKEAVILQRVYLRHDYQRQGIGQKLIAMALDTAHAQKKPLELEVLANNAAAIESYKKGGFEQASDVIVNGWNRKIIMRHKDTVQYMQHAQEKPAAQVLKSPQNKSNP